MPKKELIDNSKRYPLRHQRWSRVERTPGGQFQLVGIPLLMDVNDLFHLIEAATEAYTDATKDNPHLPGLDKPGGASYEMT